MAPVWIESGIVSLPGVDAISGQEDQRMMMATVGYVGEPDGSLPSRGVPYVCRVVVGVGNPTVQGSISVQTGIILPPNTSFATQPMLSCWINRAGQLPATDVTQDPAAACRLSPTPFPNGASNLGERLIASHNIFEIRFELVTTGPIQGVLTGYVSSFLGELFPAVALGVGVQGTFPMPPASPPSKETIRKRRVAFVAMSPQAFPDYPPKLGQEPAFLPPRPPGPRSIGTIYETYRGLVKAADFATHPAWSPDGTQIAYGDLDNTSGRFQIFVVKSNGTGARRLTTVSPLSTMSCFYPQWSADGSRIFLQATRGAAAAGTDDSFWQIWSMAADGTDPRPFIIGPSNKTFPTFTRPNRPGVETLVFLNNGNLFAVDTDERNVRQITTDPGSQRRFLAASRKHDWVAFNETPSGSSASELIVMNTLTGLSRRISGGVSPTFTPDGDWIASNVPWLVSIDGSGMFPSTVFQFGDDIFAYNLWQVGDDQLDWL